ncbi:hypothetical protein JTE90_015145 [Oedothorax gibbosus]|uniref:Uncharacterized protein n=1 Tax=Oedothorax gibbosus TaxID=931172 RepID=A0AAV6VS70_9ARAC|nr:hypothetical protein JTE90_015145 [Oedothorax gibbosus]
MNHKVMQKTPTPTPSPEPSETQMKIEPKQLFEVKNTEKSLPFTQSPIFQSKHQMPIHNNCTKPLVNEYISTNPVIDLSSIAKRYLGSVPTQNEGSLPTSSFQPATSSMLQSMDNYGERLKNMHKIRSYENRITKYRKDIKILQLKHKIQQSKIKKLKDIIKDLRRANSVGDDKSEEEDISEDMYEDEIYSAYLEHETAKSEKEDFSIDSDSTLSA